MRSRSDRVVLITGASSGIGEACAAHLHARRYRVYGTSRSAPGSVLPTWPQMIPMDVTSDASVELAVETVLSQEGRLDVVVNNAGFGVAGAVEETSPAEAYAQFEVNFFGVLRVCRAVLPSMRRQQSGYIVNISSMAGVIGIPFQGIYSASKFAVEGMTEALRLEVEPHGVRVVLIEPGDFRTNFASRRRKTEAAQQVSLYTERFTKALGVMETDEMHGPTPEKIAQRLEQIINSPSPRLRYPVGPLSERLALAVKPVLPAKLFEWGLKKYYKIK